MITIRLKRRSSKKNLTYSIIVTSSKASAQGSQFLEKIGHYNPIVDKWSNKYLYVDFDRFKFWVERGACINISLFTLMRAWFSYKQHFNWEIKLQDGVPYFYSAPSELFSEKKNNIN